MSDEVRLVLWLVGGGVFLVTFFGAAVLWLVWKRKWTRCSEKATAAVIKMERTLTEDGMPIWKALFRYSANGEAIERWVYPRNDFKPRQVGGQVPIRYNPDKAHEIILLDLIGGKTYLLVAGIVAGIGALVFAVFALVCILL